MIAVLARLLGLALALSARRFARALDDPERAQARVRRRILTGLARTAYGRSLGVTGPHDDFETKVPVVGYADLRPFLADDEASGGGHLAPDRIRFFEPTSGSGGPQKRIPYTSALLRSFRHLFAVWAHDLIVHGPGFRTGRFYFSISPRFDGPEATAGGVAVGTDDDADYLSPWLRFVLGPFFVRPPGIARERDPQAFKHKTALALLACGKLEIISVWNPSFLLVHLDHIVAEAPRLVADLRAWADRGGRGAPSRRRVDLVEAQLQGPALDVAALWPDLKLISCWRAAQAGPAADRLAARCPGVLVQGKGLLATEAPITVPLLELDEQGLGQAPLVDEVLLELEDDDGRLLPLVKAEDGHAYNLVVSQQAGLVRYRLGDRVEIAGRRGRTPLLRLLGRADAVSDLVGEKLEEGFVAGVLTALVPDRFATLVPVAGVPARYVLLLEQGPDVPDALSARLDEALMEAHHYRQARLLGQLAPPDIDVVKGAEERLAAAWTATGRKYGDLKPAALHKVPLPLASSSPHPGRSA